jgi:hypothetical protein
MSLRSCTSTADHVESHDVLPQTQPKKAPGRIMVTLGDILKFALFFFACFLISFLIGGRLFGFL